MGFRNDSFYGKRKKSSFLLSFIYGILVLGLLAAGFVYFNVSSKERIEENQDQARFVHMQAIKKALLRWKQSDYDANGRLDYPLGTLKKLVTTELVNGRSIDLISLRLANSDLRLPYPQAVDGYHFTLTSVDKKWPEEGAVKTIAILATPRVMGETGSCLFYLNLEGQAYYTNFILKEKIPTWPDRKTLEEGIWLPMPGL